MIKWEMSVTTTLHQDNTFTKPFSEETGKMIDEEVRKMIDNAYIRTKKLVNR